MSFAGRRNVACSVIAERAYEFMSYNIFIHQLTPIVPTPVFDTYWRFAAERQAIFFRRIEDPTPPWTTDPILSVYKFTNAYRASDRVSQYLIRNVVYCGSSEPREMFFRILLFKLFNKISTWELLKQGVGELSTKAYDYREYDRILTRALDSGHAIYSAAYIMPSGGARSKVGRKHRMHLRLLERMLSDGLPERLGECRSMGQAFELFLAYPTIGHFLAFQYVTDVNYSPITDFSEMEFVMPGPGAFRGIRKCFANLGGLTEAEIIKWVTERQQSEFESRGLYFQNLWGRPLQLVDCQNLFCEVDKYARVAHPEYGGKQMRKRIKQKYSLNREPIQYWYPPKWGINDRIKGSRPHDSLVLW